MTELPSEGIVWGQNMNGDTTWHAYMGRGFNDYLCGKERGSHRMSDGIPNGACLKCLSIYHRLYAQAMSGQ